MRPARVHVDGAPGAAAHAPLLRRALGTCLARLLGPGVEASLRLVADDEMTALQRAFRGKQGLTDVLSFPSDDPDYAGDVAICMSVAQAQAAALGHSLEVELAVLAVHAGAHLAGLDHERSRDEALLQAQAELGILDELGLPVEAALTRRGL